MKHSVALALIMSVGSVAAAQSLPSTPTAPPYTIVRWNEDYSYLKDPAARTDPFDAIKYIPLGSDDMYLSLGGQIRERYEHFSNNNFGAGPQDDSGFYLQRILVHADLHATEYFRFFVQGISALETGREGGARATDADELDVQQMFVDAKLPFQTGGKDSITLRVGRQELLYGAQRLISPLDWANTQRTFEGAKLSTVLGPQTIDAFLVRPIIIDKEKFNDGDRDTAFWGLYDTIALPGLIPQAGTKVEPYFLGLDKTANSTTPVDSDTYTVGARFYTNPRPWDVDVEGDYQFGQFGATDIAAWSFAFESGYTIAEVPMTPRVYLGFDIASGDRNPTDDKHQTFNQLFPLGHLYFGYIDAIGRQNIVDLHPGAELTLLRDKEFAKRVALRGDYHWFWRQSNNDAVYNAAGGVLRASGASQASYIGTELDLLVNWQVDRHFSAYAGYSHFFAGSFLEDTGPNDDIDFVYVAGLFTF